MSGTPEDEAKARLEVAQLYEGMPGQAAKAARYYFAAAEIFRGAGLLSRAREIYQKVVQLDPSNVQAQTILQSIIASAGGTQQTPASPSAAGTPAPAGQAPPTSPAAGQAARTPVQPPRPAAGNTASPQPSAPAPTGSVTVPIPWVGREPRYIAAARAQLQVPPDRFKLPYDPLPPVDPNKVAARAEARKKMQQEINRKSQTRVESAFRGSESPFGAGAKFGSQSDGSVSTGRFGRSSEGVPAASGAPAPAPAPAAPAAEQKPSRFGQPSVDLRGGNRDLADAIRRKLQGGS